MKKFCFFLGSKYCSLLAGKKCPNESGKKEDDVYSCLELTELLKRNGWNDIEAGTESYGIVLHPCGRYTISSGQHRLCIMKKEKMKIPEAYEEFIGDCRRHTWICDRYFNKIDKDLYLSEDSFIDTVDETGIKVLKDKKLVHLIKYIQDIREKIKNKFKSNNF